MIMKKLTNSEFETMFPEQWAFAIKIEQKWKEGFKSVIVCAPVKSGKRLFAQALAMRNHPKETHFFITSLDRVDIKEQLDELANYHLVVPSVLTKGAGKGIRDFSSQLEKANNPVTHFDESDYGTGKNQKFAHAMNGFEEFKGIAKGPGKFIAYSATNEEIALSEFEASNDTCTLTFEPNKNYRGAKWFLEQDLIFDADIFFDKNSITPHGLSILDDWDKNPDKKIAILRLPKENKTKPGTSFEEFKNSQAVKLELRKRKIMASPVNGKSNVLDRFDWSGKEIIEECTAYGFRALIVICQTCTRSTEIGFQKDLAFLHDYRNGTTPYSTMHQAMLRPAHYDSVGHPVKIYGQIDVFKLAAGQFSHSEYLDSNPKNSISPRIDKEHGIKTKVSQDENDYVFIMREIPNSTQIELPQLNNIFKELMEETDKDPKFKDCKKINIKGKEGIEKDNNGFWLDHDWTGKIRKHSVNEIKQRKFQGLGKPVLSRSAIAYDKNIDHHRLAIGYEPVHGRFDNHKSSITYENEKAYAILIRHTGKTIDIESTPGTKASSVYGAP